MLADLACGQLRKKLPALREALAGRFSPKHALIVGQIHAHIDRQVELLCRIRASSAAPPKSSSPRPELT